MEERWDYSFCAKCSESFVDNRRKRHPDFTLLQEEIISWVDPLQDFSRKLLSKRMISVEIILIAVWTTWGYIFIYREYDLVVRVGP
jgi:hypothetical protein